MKILIVSKSRIPALLYGGTQRVIYALGKELAKQGHEIVYLVQKGSHCDFAKVLFIDPNQPISKQIPKSVDLVHFHYNPPIEDKINVPYLITMHGNVTDDYVFDKNTVFVSKNHAQRHGSDVYVHNGLDWSLYKQPDFTIPRKGFHFLGKASWGVKNVKGAMDIAKAARQPLKILGGKRFSERIFKLGPRYFLDRTTKFEGMVGGTVKQDLLNGSKGLLFPVRWHEPFGLALIESLFYGCAVFGTPYGALPEIVNEKVGFLSSSTIEIVHAMQSKVYDCETCHIYARENFNSHKMAVRYLEKYESILRGEKLNPRSPKLINKPKNKYLDFT